MSARDLISKIVENRLKIDGFASYDEMADHILRELAISGYVILSPDEVQAIRDKAKAEALANNPLETTLAFVARMCWRTDPPNANNKFTDDQRFNAIKHHPTVKKYGQPHIELAEREKSLKGGRDAQ